MGALDLTAVGTVGMKEQTKAFLFQGLPGCQSLGRERIAHCSLPLLFLK